MNTVRKILDDNRCFLSREKSLFQEKNIVDRFLSPTQDYSQIQIGEYDRSENSSIFSLIMELWHIKSKEQEGNLCEIAYYEGWELYLFWQSS